MQNTSSESDLAFKNNFEECKLSPSEFHYRQHLRLAYVFLCEDVPHIANERMRASLKAFLKANSVLPENTMRQ